VPPARWRQFLADLVELLETGRFTAHPDPAEEGLFYKDRPEADLPMVLWEEAKRRRRASRSSWSNSAAW
jgi:hypothetical protein